MVGLFSNESLVLGCFLSCLMRGPCYGPLDVAGVGSVPFDDNSGVSWTGWEPRAGGALGPILVSADNVRRMNVLNMPTALFTDFYQDLKGGMFEKCNEGLHSKVDGLRCVILRGG